MKQLLELEWLPCLVIPMNKRKQWTQEEIDYLVIKTETISIKSMANKLDRSYDSVTNKMNELGLNAQDGSEQINLSDICSALNVSHPVVRNWIDSYGLKAKKIGKYVKIKPEDWWTWAEKNQHRVDWDRVHPKTFGIEPEWVNKLRGKPHRYTFHAKEWTKQDDAMLEYLVKQQKYTYDQISKKLDRSHSALKTRLYDLAIYERPVPKKQRRYSKEEIKTVVKLRLAGRSFQSIAEEINGNALYITDRFQVWKKRYSENYRG